MNEPNDIFGGTEPWSDIQVKTLRGRKLITKLNKDLIVKHLSGPDGRRKYSEIRDICVQRFRDQWSGQGRLSVNDMQIDEVKTEDGGLELTIRWAPTHTDCVFYGGIHHGYQITAIDRGEAQIVHEEGMLDWSPEMGADQFFVRRHIYMPSGYDWNNRRWIMKFDRVEED